jgi:hypothetical protein
VQPLGIKSVTGSATQHTQRRWRRLKSYAVKKQEVVDDVSKTYESERDQANVVATERTNTIREIYKTAPAVPVDCAGSDALRGVLESSVSDANAAAAGKPSRAVPNSPRTRQVVLIDPERALWEADIIAKYTDCSVKHRLTIKAWVDAVAEK